MIIAINTIYPGHEKTFITDIFVSLASQNPAHDFIFIFDQPFDASINLAANCKPVIISPISTKPLLWRLWYDYKIPSLLKKYKADVLVTAGICSLRTKVPQCLLLNDNFLQHPQFFLKSYFNFYKKNISRFVKKAAVIVTDSEFSKTRLVENYKIPETKIDVVYPCAAENFVPLPFDEREKIKENFADGCEYFLFSGEVSSKNNLLNLLKAFSFFKKRQKSSMRLLICGSLGWKHQAFLESLRLFKFKNEVKVYNDLTKEESAKIMAGAYAVVQTLSFQNFEKCFAQAIKSEVAIITSDTPLTREICAGAALYANPADHKSIAEKMMMIFKDENLRRELIKNGTGQQQKFSCDKMHSSLLNSILKTSS